MNATSSVLHSVYLFYHGQTQEQAYTYDKTYQGTDLTQQYMPFLTTSTIIEPDDMNRMLTGLLQCSIGQLNCRLFKKL